MQLAAAVEQLVLVGAGRLARDVLEHEQVGTRAGHSAPRHATSLLSWSIEQRAAGVYRRDKKSFAGEVQVQLVMILIAVVGIWVAGVVTVVSLCMAAKRGDARAAPAADSRFSPRESLRSRSPSCR